MDKLHEIAKPNIDKLYQQLFTIKEELSDVINVAQEAANDAGNFGGDISKVIPNQLRTQFVVGIQNFISQQGNPVAIDSIIAYLDSLPLSRVRVPRGEEAMNAVPQMGQGLAPMGGGAPMAPPPAPSGAFAGAMPNAAPAIPGDEEAGPELMAASAKMNSGKRMKEFYFHTMCPKCDTELTDGYCPECGYDSEETGGAGPDPAEHFSKVEELQSAILRAKGQDLLNETRTMWEAEHPEEEYQEGTLDFKNIKENYQRRPQTPEVFTKHDEDKVYKKITEKAEKPATKLQEADMLASPYARPEINSMEGWRDLVETHVNDDEINERLGAAAVANVLLSEADEMDKKTGKSGIQRMKEIVTPEEPGFDAGDVAAMLVSGKIKESDFSDEIKPSRLHEAMQPSGDFGGGEDLAALVMGDAREPVGA